jgi:tRNA threonylcarbamoyladenosine biosynthesis protein TsaB
VRILAIDTSTPVGSIAIVEGALLRAQHILNISATHNQRLLPGAWATGKPLAGVPTLDALAANVPLAPYPIYPVLDARKGEIYTALYRMDDEQVPARLTPYMAIKPEKLVDLISEKTLLVGDALLRYRDYLTDKLGERLHLVPPHLNVVHASSVAWLAWHKLRRGIHEDISSCTPLYVRPSEAELNRISE